MSYALYIAGSSKPEARAGKRQYIADRRKAGKESMSGYAEPKVEKIPGRAPIIKLRPVQVQILDCLVEDGANTDVLARRVGVTPETVRRHLRVIYRALGYTDRAELVAALLRRQVDYRLAA